MRCLLLYFTLTTVTISCIAPKKTITGIESRELKNIVELYMQEYPEIPNKCNAKPYYKIYFIDYGDKIGFWLAGHLGEPGKVPPARPGAELDRNPIELKGCFTFNKSYLIIYDFRNSDGYGLYEPSKLNVDSITDIKSVPDSCAHVWYPEAWYYIVAEDSIYLSDKREAFKLQ